MTDEITARTPLICSDERHAAKVADLERRIKEQAVETDRLTAELADYDQRVEHLTAALAGIQDLADEYPAGIDTALILEALDQTQAPANPPGSTVEQLPAHVLALITLPSYTSTACELAELLTAAIPAHPQHAGELAHWVAWLRDRCRANNKFTGVLCDHRGPGVGPDLVSIVDKPVPADDTEFTAPAPAATQATDTTKD